MNLNRDVCNQVTKEQLTEKNIALEKTREELAENRMELESLKITPASDACKGKVLFKIFKYTIMYRLQIR